MTTYYWDEFVGRFRDERGRFVSRDVVLNFVNKSLEISSNAVDVLSSHVFSGTISSVDWYSAMQQEIKDEYIRQYLSFIGGRNMMTPSDWGKIGAMLREQYGYLKGFRSAIETEELTEKQIAARARMYINSAREAREEARARSAAKAGFDEVYWITTAKESCEDCIKYTKMGWVMVADDPYKGAKPGSGHTICLTACQCILNYRNSKTGEEYAY